MYVTLSVDRKAVWKVVWKNDRTVTHLVESSCEFSLVLFSNVCTFTPKTNIIVGGRTHIFCWPNKVLVIHLLNWRFNLAINWWSHCVPHSLLTFSCCIALSSLYWHFHVVPHSLVSTDIFMLYLTLYWHCHGVPHSLVSSDIFMLYRTF